MWNVSGMDHDRCSGTIDRCVHVIHGWDGCTVDLHDEDAYEKPMTLRDLSMFSALQGTNGGGSHKLKRHLLKQLHLGNFFKWTKCQTPWCVAGIIKCLPIQTLRPTMSTHLTAWVERLPTSWFPSALQKSHTMAACSALLWSSVVDDDNWCIFDSYCNHLAVIIWNNTFGLRPHRKIDTPEHGDCEGSSVQNIGALLSSYVGTWVFGI